ncbi:helix-turn-helix domain-containing protein [Rhodospirillales bacterium]|jgi:transcriptional regulator with XRE-family HTH domain|nr:helix-turn-helix domain-containing protein [Rhodospirillales bacterium]MDC1214580.1 helix-turn-helix domain-containing protein [Rhodospirillales bacterium]
MKSKDVNNGSVSTDIRARRKNRAISLTEFAESLNRSIGFISQIERCLSSPSINDLRVISDFLGMPICLFFGDNSTPPTY